MVRGMKIIKGIVRWLYSIFKENGENEEYRELYDKETHMED